MTDGRVSGAILSDCGRYRYRLWRALPASISAADRGCVTWLMLNPSTADATTNDPTLRKCIGFSERWHFTELQVVNLFAWRSTEPRGLLYANGDPVGSLNDQHLDEAVSRSERVVLAWGAQAGGLRKPIAERAELVLRHLAAIPGAREIGHLGFAKDGRSPRHPLMLAYATEFVSWT